MREPVWIEPGISLAECIERVQVRRANAMRRSVDFEAAGLHAFAQEAEREAVEYDAASLWLQRVSLLEPWR